MVIMIHSKLFIHSFIYTPTLSVIIAFPSSGGQGLVHFEHTNYGASRKPVLQHTQFKETATFTSLLFSQASSMLTTITRRSAAIHVIPSFREHKPCFLSICNCSDIVHHTYGGIFDINFPHVLNTIIR